MNPKNQDKQLHLALAHVDKLRRQGKSVEDAISHARQRYGIPGSTLRRHVS